MNKDLLTLLLRATRKTLLLSTLVAVVASAFVGPDTALQAIGRIISRGVASAAACISEKQLDWRAHAADTDRERFVAAVARRKGLTDTITRLSISRCRLETLLGGARRSLAGRLGDLEVPERVVVVGSSTADRPTMEYQAEQTLGLCFTLEREIARHDAAISRLKSIEGTLESILNKTGRSLSRRDLELFREREETRGHRFSDEALSLVESMRTPHEER
jgi:hypothetical protein